jgi:signal transduction histidine kinase
VVADRAPAILASGRRVAFADRGGATVSGRAGALILALENLIDNAMRHTPPDTLITVEAGPGARLRVNDDGPPIDAAHLSAMATRFWRAGNAKGEGSGLGLSIVARVAGAHDGRLLLEPGADGRGLDAVLLLESDGAFHALDGSSQSVTIDR